MAIWPYCNIAIIWHKKVQYRYRLLQYSRVHVYVHVYLQVLYTCTRVGMAYTCTYTCTRVPVWHINTQYTLSVPVHVYLLKYRYTCSTQCTRVQNNINSNSSRKCYWYCNAGMDDDGWMDDGWVDMDGWMNG